MSSFEDDRWQLFHTDEDRSEAHDLAEQHPERVEELKALWIEEAKANNVLPLNDLRSSATRRTSRRSSRWSSTCPCPRAGSTPTTRARARSRSARRPTSTASRTRSLAEVELTPRPQGVIFAHGSRFGGHALFVKDGQLTYVYNFLGIPPENAISGPAPHVGPAHRRRRLHEGADGRAPRVASARCSCTSTTRSWPRRRSAR